LLWAYDSSLFIIANCRLPITDLVPIGNRQLEIGNVLIPTVRQHRHHAIVIRFGHEHVDIELAFTLISFLRQNVSRVRMATLDLSSGGQAHSLRCTLMSLQFRHNPFPFKSLSQIADCQLPIAN
jgi:hypothetical protein